MIPLDQMTTTDKYVRYFKVGFLTFLGIGGLTTIGLLLWVFLHFNELMHR